MARLSRDARLETRDARSRLAPRDNPYWRQIHVGLKIGYRKGTRSAVWIAKRLVNDGRYVTSRLGLADDRADADGSEVLSYAQAHAKALKFAGDAEEPQRRVTVAEAGAHYLAWFKVHRKSHDKTRLVWARHILPAFGPRTLESLNGRELREWHRRLVDDASPERLRARKATANRVLTIFKALLNHAWREGLVKSDEAWRRVKPFHNVEAATIRYLTEDQCVRLLNACAPDFRDLARGALLTGCRYGELRELRCGDVDLQANSIAIQQSKSGKPRHVPLTDEGIAFFDRLTVGRPGDRVFLRADGLSWGPAHQTRPMLEACRRAGINPPVGVHILRHTYASILTMKGVPLQVVAAVLGHSDSRMTEKHYAHLAPSFVADVIRASLPAFGLPESRVRRIR